MPASFVVAVVVAFFLAALLAISSDAFARPKIGVALSGGGARALAEIGVLRALEEEGIPVDCIAGNSMGAVLGGLYAAGVSAESLLAISREPETFAPSSTFSHWSVFQKQVLRPEAFALHLDGWEYRLPTSLVHDYDVNWLLLRHVTWANLEAQGDFDRLPVPFRSVALDLTSGEEVSFQSGDLARAIRSSMAVPVTFQPVHDRATGRVWIDAGVRDNLPIGAVRSMGADRVIAVNCTEPWAPRPELDDVTQVAFRLVDILSARVDSISLDGWDVWIEPRVGDAGVTDYDLAAEMIEEGYRATRAQMPRIRQLLREDVALADARGRVDDTDPLAVPPLLPAEPPREHVRDVERRLGELRVAWIRLEGRRVAYSWVPRTELGFQRGDVFSLPRLGKGLRRLYATNLYESIWPRLTLVDSTQIGITLELEERTPTVLSVGLLYDNSRLLNVSLAYVRNNLLRLGESWYLDLALGSFRDGVEAGVRSGRLRGVPLALDLETRISRTRYRREDGGDLLWQERALDLSTGLVGGHNALLLAGARLVRSEGEAVGGRETAGAEGSTLPFDWRATDKSLFVQGWVDGTDDRVHPSRGVRGRLEWELFLPQTLEASHQNFNGELAAAKTLGRITLTPAVLLAARSRGENGFRFQNRLDLTRASWGRFESRLYSPCLARADFMADVRLAPALSFWSSLRAALRANEFDLLERAPAELGLEGGLLQRTPVGPVFLGITAEEHRAPFVFVQVGHDLAGRR